MRLESGYTHLEDYNIIGGDVMRMERELSVNDATGKNLFVCLFVCLVAFLSPDLFRRLAYNTFLFDAIVLNFDSRVPIAALWFNWLVRCVAKVIVLV
jgi:hypothetical protein